MLFTERVSDQRGTCALIPRVASFHLDGPPATATNRLEPKDNEAGFELALPLLFIASGNHRWYFLLDFQLRSSYLTHPKAIS
jgi:hypothetical protein